MTPPWQAVAGVAWAVIAPPLLLYGATRVGRGQVRRHWTIMLVAVVVELVLVMSFTALMEPSPRRGELGTLQIFKIHLAFAIATLVGIVWQLVSRVVPALRPLHRQSGPYVLLVWCLALATGIYNYLFLYVMR